MGMNNDYDRWLEEQKRKQDEAQMVALGIARVLAIVLFALVLMAFMSKLM